MDKYQEKKRKINILKPFALQIHSLDSQNPYQKKK